MIEVMGQDKEPSHMQMVTNMMDHSWMVKNMDKESCIIMKVPNSKEIMNLISDKVKANCIYQMDLSLRLLGLMIWWMEMDCIQMEKGNRINAYSLIILK